MTWYQKPKRPAEPTVPLGVCVICGTKGSVQLGESPVQEVRPAVPSSLWFCQRCAEESRGEAELN